MIPMISVNAISEITPPPKKNNPRTASIVVPAVTVAGAVFVTAISLAVTIVTVRAELLSGFGSLSAFTVVVFVYVVPDGVPGGMWPVRMNVPFVPAASDAIEQSIVPFAPTAGVVHEYPAGCDSDTNVMSPGSVSLIVTFTAAFGPPLPTRML